MPSHGFEIGAVGITKAADGKCKRHVFRRSRMGQRWLDEIDSRCHQSGKRRVVGTAKTDFCPFPEGKHAATSNEKTTDQSEEIIVSLGNTIFLQ